MTNSEASKPLFGKHARHFTSAAVAVNIALLLATPVFLVLNNGAARCGVVGIPKPMILSLLSVFVWLLVTRSWGAFFFTNAPLLLLAPAYAWYVVNFSTAIDETVIETLTNSSLQEAWGFLSLENLWLFVIVCLALFALYLALAFALWNSPRPGWLRQIYLYAAFPLALTAIFIPERGYAHDGFDAVETGAECVLSSYPAGGVASLVGSIALTVRKSIDDHEKLPREARLIAADGEMETHILVIGESARFDAFHVNGYGRPTSPILDRMPDVVSYQNAYTTSNTTTTSVTLALTGLAPEAFADARNRGGLLKAARLAGYYVVWLSNNAISFARNLGAGRDVCQPPENRTSNEFVWDAPVPDAVLLPCLDRELEKPEKLKFIVLHTYGSHWDYAKRLPDDGFRISAPTRKLAIERRSNAASSERVARDIYDDTISYTDWFLGQVIARAAGLPGRVTVTYFSDHGESFRFLDGVAGHARPEFSVAEAHVPLFFWANSRFVTDRERQWRGIRSHRDQTFRMDGMFYTLASIMGIGFPELDVGRDLTDERYLAPARREDITMLAGSQLRPLRAAVDWGRR